jgi:hypothetical protein
MAMAQSNFFWYVPDCLDGCDCVAPVHHHEPPQLIARSDYLAGTASAPRPCVSKASAL